MCLRKCIFMLNFVNRIHFYYYSSYSSYRFIFLSFFRKKTSRFRLQKYCKKLVSARNFDYQVLSEVLFSLIKMKIILLKESIYLLFYYFCKHEVTSEIHSYARHHGSGLHLRISDLLARGALSVSGKGG